MTRLTPALALALAGCARDPMTWRESVCFFVGAGAVYSGQACGRWLARRLP